MDQGTKLRIRAFLLISMLIPALAYAGLSGPSPIPPPPRFVISTSTQTVCRGISNIVPVNITDNSNNYDGAGMQDVSFSLDNKNLIAPATETINSINPHNSTVVDMPVFVNLSAPIGLINIQVPISYTFLNLYNDSEVRNLTMDIVNCPSSLPITLNISSYAIVSGQVNNLTLSFTNTGNTTLRNISAQTSISSSQSGIEFVGHAPIEISSLAPHSTANVIQRLYENSSQIFSLNTTVTLFYNGTFEEMESSFPMLSSGTVDMIPSSISITPTSVSAGSIFLVSFVLTDTGTSGVSNANASAVLPAGFSTYGTSSSTFIGSIGAETPTPVSITLMANSSVKPGSYKIPIKLDYQGSFRQTSSSYVNVTVNVTSGSSASSSGTAGSTAAASSSSSSSNIGLYIAIGTFIVIIGAIFGLQMMRQRRAASAAKPK